MVLENKELWGTNGESISFHIPYIANIADRSQEIVVQQNTITLTDGAHISFEWGGIMYEDTETSQAVLLSPQENNSSFTTYFQAGNSIGLSHIRYRFLKKEIQRTYN